MSSAVLDTSDDRRVVNVARATKELMLGQSQRMPFAAGFQARLGESVDLHPELSRSWKVMQRQTLARACDPVSQACRYAV